MDLLFLDTQNIVTLALLAVLSCLVIPYLVVRSRKNRYPPGPFLFPILGNLPQIALCGNIDAFCAKYRKLYGNVFTFEIGGNKRVVVSSYEVFKELFIKNGDITSTRSTQSRDKEVQERLKKTPGLMFAPNPHWKTLRTFALQHLREDGMGRSALEPQIMEEIEHYINNFIKPHHNRPIDMTLSIAKATCNIMSQLLFHRRFEYDDERNNIMVSGVSQATKLTMKIGLISNIPFHQILFRSIYKLYKQNAARLVNQMTTLVEEYNADLDTENPRGLLDMYLIHSKTKEGQTNYCFAESNARAFIIQFYGAGTETTSTALKWCLLYMCKNPAIQEKVHKEIDAEISGKQVTYKDRLQMPYTDAVLLETLRCANMVPTALPHTMEKDFVVDGKLIPAGADMLLNMASVLHDEKVFKQPRTFRPERYFEGDVAMKKQHTLPFSLGRRNCIGESLAKVEFFMFFVTFMQMYSVSLPKGSTADPSKITSDIVNAPNPYDIIFHPRNTE